VATKPSSGAEETRAARESAEAPIREQVLEDAHKIGAALDEDRLAAEKLHLYESFVKGRISRPALDRKLDDLYSRQNSAMTGGRTDRTGRQPHADRIINYYLWWSGGVGLLPFPVIDTLGVMTIQVVMLRKLCELYETPFSQQWGKGLISALLGGVTPAYVKAWPGFGSLIGMITSPACNVAATYAVGKVFVQHFESGGTLLTFDPVKMKDYFREYYSAGKKLEPNAA